MAINKDSNGYTFGFAIVMVVIVGSVLSFAAMQLKPFQDKNLENEKKQSILAAIGVETDLKGAAAEFDKYVKNGFVLNAKGEKKGDLEQGIEGAFAVDVKKEYKSIDAEERSYPLFECQKDEKTIYVIPMVGTGLWGPIWGFVALEDDFQKVFGASFDHKTETPGLGAEINKEGFEGQFSGKSVYEGSAVRLSVVKAGKGIDYNNYDVDGISGGTITSVGVDEMIKRTMAIYLPFKSQMIGSNE